MSLHPAFSGITFPFVDHQNNRQNLAYALVVTAPFVLKRGSTVGELAGKVHKDFQEKLKWAKVWGSGVYDGQLVNRDYVLHDGDVVELHI